MAITVLYFAALRDLVRMDQECIEVPSEIEVVRILDLLHQKHPQLNYEGVRCAVNEEFVALDHPVQDGDTLALIPPVSGG